MFVCRRRCSPRSHARLAAAFCVEPLAEPTIELLASASEKAHPRQTATGMIYCRGGVGARDDAGAIGARDDCGPDDGLRAGVAIGRGGGGAGIFASISTSAVCSFPI